MNNTQIVLRAIKQILGAAVLPATVPFPLRQWVFVATLALLPFVFQSRLAVSAPPDIVSWPGMVKAGTRTQAMVNWTDLLPTLLEVAGGKAPTDIDGRSFFSVLRGDSNSHRDRIFATHSNDNRMNVYPSRSVRNERWKYIRNLHPEYAFTTHIDLVAGGLGQRAFFATWENAAKSDPKAAAILKRYHERPAEELYDLMDDPHEQKNVEADPNHSEILNDLRVELSAWIKSQGDEQKTFAEPRLLSDPLSYGPQGEINSNAQQPPQSKAVR